MATQRITKTTLEGAAPTAKRYTIFDSGVAGFGLRVFPSGERSWIFEYRPYPGGAGTPKRRVTIGNAGRYGSIDMPDFSPDEARKRADQLRVTVKTGGDPMGEKAALKEAPTVKEVSEAFMRDHIKAKRADSTAAAYQDIFDRLVLPKLGKRKAKDITGRDMSALHNEWADTPYQANKMLAVVGSMYSWATGPVGMLPAGLEPTAGIGRFTETKRGDVLSAAQLERLGAAIRLAETAGIPWKVNEGAKAKHRAKDVFKRVTVISEPAAAALRLLIFTGARVSEILNLRWDQINFEQGLAMLAKHKTSRTHGQKAIVLNAPALAVLNALPRLGKYVIAGEAAGTADEKPRADLKRPWELVRQHAGLDELRLHDLRHNFGGFGAGGGYGLPLIGRLLGHSQPATTARYTHFDADPVRRAAEGIGSALAARLDGKSSDVVPIRRKLGSGH